jgi:hypothetical protein
VSGHPQPGPPEVSRETRPPQGPTLGGRVTPDSGAGAPPDSLFPRQTSRTALTRSCIEGLADPKNIMVLSM